MFKRLSGLFLVFGVVMLLSFGLNDRLASLKMDYRVVAGANAILLLLGIISLSLHTRALSNSNPNVFVRSVMLANVIKILVLAATAFLYITVAGKKAVSTNAVFVSLFLYIVYTWVEKRETIKMSKSQKN